MQLLPLSQLTAAALVSASAGDNGFGHDGDGSTARSSARGATIDWNTIQVLKQGAEHAVNKWKPYQPCAPHHFNARYWWTVVILSWSMAGRTKQHKPEDNNLESQYLHRCKSWGGLKLEDGIMKFKQLGC